MHTYSQSLHSFPALDVKAQKHSPAVSQLPSFLAQESVGATKSGISLIVPSRAEQKWILLQPL